MTQVSEVRRNYRDSGEASSVVVSLPATEESFDHGAKSSISTAAVQLSATSIPLNRGVLIKAANANTGTVYVGNSDVTRGTADATDGFELGAGESLFLETENLNQIYVIGSAASQKVFYVTM